jgi:predicted phosphodiesterase
MRTLVISDLHLTHHFDQRKFQLLKELLSNVDRVVLNGDFWDSYISTFEQFITSEWTQLFSILKSKETYYIFGNHDKEAASDSRRELFSNYSGKSFTLPASDKKHYFTHGDSITHATDSIFPFLTKIKAIVDAYSVFKLVGVKTLGRYFYLREVFDNAKMKKWRKDNLASDTVLFCGHTHLSEANVAEGFYNSGFIEHGHADYILIENDLATLYFQNY